MKQTPVEAYVKRGAISLVAFIFSCTAIASSIETVSTGHYAVATRFGDVTGQQLAPGFHLTNPILSWDHFNTLQRTITFDDIEVPAADQQKAIMDVSVQYAIRPDAVVNLRRDTGTEDQAVEVHFLPYTRGALRDAGRSTKRVEDFFASETVEKYESVAMQEIQSVIGPLGFEVTAVIVRDVDLPPVIAQAIEAKKQREQEVEKERATLLQVELQTQQRVKEAQADKEATIKRAEAEKESAALKAEAVRIAAEAEAFKIDRLQRELSKSPNYVELVKAERWNGALPQFAGGGAIPFLSIPTGGK